MPGAAFDGAIFFVWKDLSASFRRVVVCLLPEPPSRNRAPWPSSFSSLFSKFSVSSNAVDASVLYEKTELPSPSSSRPSRPSDASSSRASRARASSRMRRSGVFAERVRTRLGASRHRRVPGSPSSELESGSEESPRGSANFAETFAVDAVAADCPSGGARPSARARRRTASSHARMAHADWFETRTSRPSLDISRQSPSARSRSRTRSSRAVAARSRARAARS